MSEHVLLILGSMDEFVALVDDAKSRGYKTIVADGYADGPAKAHADVALDIPVDDTAALCEACAAHGVDGMITAYSDVLFENMVKLSCASGIPCYGNYAGMLWLRSKSKMKQMFEMQGIPYPKSVILVNEAEVDRLDLQYPCVMKPCDGYGSRGVFIVEDAEQIAEHFSTTMGYCLHEKGVVVEEYCTGCEFNMISWITQGRAVVVSIADREKSHEVEGDIPHISRLVYPSRFWREVIDQARAIVQKVAVFTGIQNGPLCMQFFWSPEEGIKVCETAGRVFGYEHELVELGSGLRIEDLLLDTVYEPANLHERLASHGMESFDGTRAGLYFHGHERVIGSLTEARAAVDEFGDVIEDALWYYEEGDRISHGRGAKPYLLRLYVASNTYDELDDVTSALFERVSIEDDAGSDLVYRNEVPDYRR